MATDKEKVIKLVSEQKHKGIPAQYNGVGETVEPNCEDKMEIYLQVNPRQVITDVGYTITSGACAPVEACAMAAADLALNKPVMEAYTITHEEIAAFITDDGIPDKEHVHCTIMAELTLKKAVLDYVHHRSDNVNPIKEEIKQ